LDRKGHSSRKLQRNGKKNVQPGLTTFENNRGHHVPKKKENQSKKGVRGVAQMKWSQLRGTKKKKKKLRGNNQKVWWTEGVRGPTSVTRKSSGVARAVGEKGWEGKKVKVPGGAKEGGETCPASVGTEGKLIWFVGW